MNNSLNQEIFPASHKYIKNIHGTNIHDNFIISKKILNYSPLQYKQNLINGLKEFNYKINNLSNSNLLSNQMSLPTKVFEQSKVHNILNDRNFFKFNQCNEFNKNEIFIKEKHKRGLSYSIESLPNLNLSPEKFDSYCIREKDN